MKSRFVLFGPLQNLFATEHTEKKRVFSKASVNPVTRYKSLMQEVYGDGLEIASPPHLP
jgi:hypothetical protein